MLPTLERAVDALFRGRRRVVATVVGSVAGDGEWRVARRPDTVVTKQQAYWMDGGHD